MSGMDWLNRRVGDGAEDWLSRTVERPLTWTVRPKVKSAENEFMNQAAWKVKTAAEGVSPLHRGTRKPTKVHQGVGPVWRSRFRR